MLSFRRWLLLLAGCAAILVWQIHLYRQAHLLDSTYRNRYSTGISRHHQHFIPFLHHLDLYPVATLSPIGEDSPAGLRRILDENGASLRTEIRHAMRNGDHLRTYLYLPDVWLSGKTLGVSLIPAHTLWFWSGLLALYFGFWRIGRPGLGLLVVGLMGSNPFQLFAVYQEENIFSWGGSTALFLLGLHLPLLEEGGKPERKTMVLALASGLLLGTLSHVRIEPVMLVLSCLGVYLTLVRGGWRWRVFLSSLLMLGFVSASSAWGNHFESKIAHAYATVKAAGGIPFEGPQQLYHPFWHTLYTGLGDFDDRFGHAWDDRVSFRRIMPRLQQVYGVEIPPWDGRSYVFDTSFWDVTGANYKTLYELPHHSDAARDLFLQEIGENPGWYAGILLRRGWTLLTNLVPLRLEWGEGRLTIPWSGFLIFPALAWLVWRRDLFAIKLILFALPLSFTAFIVYSLRGASYYTLYHYMVAVALLLHFVRYRFRSGARRSSPLSA